MKDYLFEKGYDVQFGARPLKRAIQKYIEDELADIILREKVGKKYNVYFNYDKEQKKVITEVKE